MVILPIKTKYDLQSVYWTIIIGLFPKRFEDLLLASKIKFVKVFLMCFVLRRSNSFPVSMANIENALEKCK